MPRPSSPRLPADSRIDQKASQDAAKAPGTAEEPRRRRAYLPAKERKAQIILAAQEVFARANLQGARTRDIAKAADVNQATLFEHFESKEALFHEAVVEPMIQALQGLEYRAQIYEEANSLEEMQALAEGSAERHLEIMVEIFPLMAAALFSDLELGRKLYCEEIAPLLRERGKAVRRLMKDDIDPELVEMASFGMFFAMAMDKTFMGDKVDISGKAAQLTRLAMAAFTKGSGKD